MSGLDKRNFSMRSRSLMMRQGKNMFVAITIYKPLTRVL